MTTFKMRGFTLIEMAVVLVIVGLMLGGLLMPLSTQMENDRRKETAATLESIREALIGYAIINRKLPCPDYILPRDGIGDCGGGAPNGTPSGLPYADLGVSSVDAWGNPLSYAVSNTFTTLISNASVGNINVGTPTNCTGALLARNVPALVRSNGKTSYPTLENENTNTSNTCFIDAGYRQVTNGFDDLLIWIPPGLLMSRMAAAGQLP